MARGLVLSADDRLRRELINALMCQGEIDIDAFGARHDIDFRRYFADALDALREFEADGLVQWQGARLRISARGRLLTRQVAMRFDAYLGTAQNARYSRAI